MNWQEKTKWKIGAGEWELSCKPIGRYDIPIEEWGSCDSKCLKLTVYLRNDPEWDLHTFLEEALHAMEEVGLHLGITEQERHAHTKQLALLLAKFLLDNGILGDSEPEPEQKEDTHKQRKGK